MDLGASFVNVFEGLGSGDPDVAFRGAIDAAAARGGPCTFWISRRVTLAANHVIPFNATLAFAPGAYLRVAGALTVEGHLDAGLEPRFELLDGAALALLGPLEELVANWWVATPGRPTPVEQAIAALWTRYQRGRLPAPIRLTSHRLERPLRLRPPMGLSGRYEIRLRGQWARSVDPPTFVAGGGSADAPMSTLVSAEEGVVLQLDHVAFDAQPASGARSLACLSLEGTFHGSRVEACGFRFGRAGIRVSPNVQRWIEATGDVTSAAALQGRLADAILRSTDRPNGLTVDHCVFTGASTWARGLDIDFGAPTSLDLRNSQFVGAFANGVAILGGDAKITACQFANQTKQIAFDPLNPVEDAKAQNIQKVKETPETVADILLRRWGDPYYEQVYTPLDTPLWQPVLRDRPPNVYQGRPLSGTHLTVVHCTSTSPVFLVMHQAFTYDGTIAGGAMLTGVRHAPAGEDPGSIFVRRGASGRSLMLQGCRFGGSVYLDEGARDGTVVDLGTVFTGRVQVGFNSNPRYSPINVITLATPP